MFLNLKKVMKPVAAVLALTAASTALVSCGKMKTQSEKTVKVTSAEPENEEGLVRNLLQFSHTYLGPDAKVDSVSAQNIMNNFRDDLARLTGIKDLPVESLIEAAVQLLPEFQSGLTLDQINKRIRSRLFVIQWFSEKNELNENEISQKIQDKYPTATAAAVNGLTQSLMRFDQKWIGGNENATLSTTELAFASLMLSELDKMDFSVGIPFHIQGVAEQKLTKELVESKIEQQIFGRYMVKDLHGLSPVDLKLEFMKFAMRLFHASSTVGVTQVVFPADYQKAITQVLDFSQVSVDEAVKLAHLYNQKFLLGDDNTTLNTLELFMLVTDYEFAVKVKRTINTKEFDSLNASAVYPRAGKPVFDALREEISSIESSEEMINALVALKVTDIVYRLYDVNQDNYLNRDEAKLLMEEIGTVDSRLASAFFADAGLEAGSSKFIAAIEIFFKGGGKSKLRPDEFYKRAVKVISRMDEFKKPAPATTIAETPSQQ